MEPDSTESSTDSDGALAFAIRLRGGAGDRHSGSSSPLQLGRRWGVKKRTTADSSLQQRLWALAVCGLGPNSDDKGVRGCGGKGRKNIFILWNCTTTSSRICLLEL